MNEVPVVREIERFVEGTPEADPGFVQE